MDKQASEAGCTGQLEHKAQQSGPGYLACMDQAVMGWFKNIPDYDEESIRKSVTINISLEKTK